MFGILKIGKLGASMKKAGFNPRTLFAASEPGAWYDPSDFSTMFQDAAGTIPVTAVEQPVGKILDKSGNGNHATQPTATSRPVLSARYNLLTYSEQCWDTEKWAVGSTLANFFTVTNSTDVPNIYGGTTGVAKFVANASTSMLFLRKVITLNAATYSPSIFIYVPSQAGVTSWQLIMDAEDVEISAPSAASTTFDRWVRAQIPAVTTTASRNFWDFNILPNGVAPPPPGFTFYAMGAQLIATNDLPSNEYQRVVTSTDYDANPAKFKPYLRFDGVDDSLATGNINFTSTDKMTVVAGVRKLSDAAIGGLVELSDNFSSNNGSFAFNAPGDPATARYSMGLRGTATAFGGAEPFAAPITNVVAWSLDIAATGVTNEIVSRVNGVNRTLVNTSGNDAGTGTYGNYPLYIGARAGTSLYFNGRLYGLIVRGAQSTLSQIEATELYMKKKVGIA